MARLFMQRIASALSYTTVRQVKVHSVTVGLIYAGLCAVIVAYVLGYEFFLGHGYQDAETVKGTVQVKVKGTARSDCAMGLRDCVDGMRVWDTTDLTLKAENSVFITTALQNTVQTQGRCAGARSDPLQPHFDENCTAAPTGMCQDGHVSWSGVQTGRCLPADQEGTRWCEVRGWCPAEREGVEPLPMQGVDEWTLFVRLYGEFAKFGESFDNANGTSLVEGYNLFSVRDLLGRAGIEYDTIRSGGVDLLMQFALDCNLDSSEQCVPALTVARVEAEDSELSKGFNERTAIRFSQLQGNTTDGSAETKLARELWKRYGIKVRILLTGQARRFDAVVAATRLGAGLALLSVATVIADLLILYVLPRRSEYYSHKFDEVYINHDHDGAHDGTEAHEDELAGAWRQAPPSAAQTAREPLMLGTSRG